MVFYVVETQISFKGMSPVRQRRDLADTFNNACNFDSDCTGDPVVKCVHDGLIGQCQFTWWFILILVALAVLIIGGVICCLCLPCCCLYECIRNLCCCCCS